MYKCTNCKWEGDVLSELPLKDKCPICGDEVSGTNINNEVKNLKSNIKDRVVDFIDDLRDDGKRNYSNRKNKLNKKGAKK